MHKFKHQNFSYNDRIYDLIPYVGLIGITLWDLEKALRRKVVVMGCEEKWHWGFGLWFFMKIVFGILREVSRRRMLLLGFEKKYDIGVLGFCFWQILFLNFEKVFFFDKDCLWILRETSRKRVILGYEKKIALGFWDLVF